MISNVFSKRTEVKQRRLRRPHGMGSIEEVVPGQKYIVTYEIPRRGNNTPRRQRRETIFGARKAAEDRLRDRLAEVRSGAYPDEDKLTFDALADRYLAAKAISREATTIAWYKRHLAQHVRPAIGHLQLRSTRAHHVQTMLSGGSERVPHQTPRRTTQSHDSAKSTCRRPCGAGLGGKTRAPCPERWGHG